MDLAEDNAVQDEATHQHTGLDEDLAEHGGDEVSVLSSSWTMPACGWQERL